MARIYYKEEKIEGAPIETPVINLKNFDFLMECPKPQLSFELAPNEQGKYVEWFRHTAISNRAQHYSAGEGKFYLPQAIIFCDIEDFVFPSQYYFMAKIGDQLEIRSVKGGENIKWFQTPDLHEPVTDSSVIVKMHGSILSIIEYLKDYKAPEKPKVEGVKLGLQAAEKFIAISGAQKELAQKIVDMAGSPSDYFEANKEQLRKHQILDPSRNMYLLYLAAEMEEGGILATVDWKEEYSEVLHALNKLSGLKFESIDGDKYKRSTAGKILSALNKQVEGKTDKTIFCIDTNSDSYSFGLIEKDRFEELKKAGKELGIKVYVPKK